MNINTERIICKKFSVPINSKIHKKSYEYRVLATLRYLFPDKYSAMILSDAPDLQDSANNTGIEVVNAVSENDMKAARAFSELPQCNVIEKKKKIKKIESCGYSLSKIIHNIVAIDSTGTDDGEKKIFQNAIRKKLEKIHRYTANFKRIGLAILLPEMPTSYSENHFHKWISETFKECNSSFDFIYVISERFCNYYESENTAYVKISITKEEDLCLKKIGRMTAEGEISLADIEWQ